MKIKRVSSKDASRWQEAVSSLVPRAYRGNRLASRDEIGLAANDSRCYIYIALAGDAPAGLLSAYRFPDVEAGGQIVYLYNIEIDPDHRRRGVGTRLINELKKDCLSDGVRLIWAGTERKNVAARKTFETTGGVPAGDSYVEYEWDLSK